MTALGRLSISVSQNRRTFQPFARRFLLMRKSRVLLDVILFVQNSLFFRKDSPVKSFVRLPCQNELSQKIRILVPLIRKSGWPATEGCLSKFRWRFLKSPSILSSRVVPRLLTLFIRWEVS